MLGGLAVAPVGCFDVRKTALLQARHAALLMMEPRARKEEIGDKNGTYEVHRIVCFEGVLVAYA